MIFNVFYAGIRIAKSGIVDYFLQFGTFTFISFFVDQHSKAVFYIRIPELLDEINVAKGCGTLKKVLRSYQKAECKRLNFG